MEQCRVCGKPITSNFWSGTTLKYCSFTCQAYGWRNASIIIMVLTFLFFLLSHDFLIFFIFIIFAIYTVLGFTTITNQQNFNQSQFQRRSSLFDNPNVNLNSLRRKVPERIYCLNCRNSLTIDDKFCPICGQSTNDSLLSYYSKKFQK